MAAAALGNCISKVTRASVAAVLTYFSGGIPVSASKGMKFKKKYIDFFKIQLI